MTTINSPKVNWASKFGIILRFKWFGIVKFVLCIVQLGVLIGMGSVFVLCVVVSFF